MLPTPLDDRPTRLGFLLLPHFSLMAFSSACEPLRAANQLSGRPLYDYPPGGCRDGLFPDRANENQGAESTLIWLLSLLEMRLAESNIPETRE